MTTTHRYGLLCALSLVLLGYAACASVPKIEKPQFTWQHYVYSVLLVPEKLSKSPQLEVAMSLLRMEYPQAQADALHTIMYAQTDLDAYKEMIYSEQRRSYRSKASELSADGSNAANYNWRYAEKFNIRKIHSQAIIIERDLETFYGSAQRSRNKTFYNILIESNEFRQVTLDDLFANVQEDQRFRDTVYDELRNFANLGSAQPLSQGIYFSNEPELTFNFFIAEEGLGLHWDPAQIAPFSHGSIEFILPWSVVRPLMLYTGIELLAKFDIRLFE